MKLAEEKIPILSCIDNNVLSEKIQKFVDAIIIYDDKERSDLNSSFPFFVDKELQINYISKSIHNRLLDTSNFVKAKKLLKGSPTTVGLLLLPETIYSDFSNHPDYSQAKSEDYPINAILYSWLSMDEHDRISNQNKLSDLKRRIEAGEKPPAGADWDRYIKELENEDEWGNDEDRELLILPIYDNGITQATNQYEMINNDELYGWDYSEQEGRSWYGKIHDYVMSFILFYNYTETETKVVHGIDSGEQRRVKLNGEKFINTSKNDIEIIDSTYFTKLIRVGEFGVKGHFRVQRHGVGSSDTKIIFIEEYKKNGYIRDAKIKNN